MKTITELEWRDCYYLYRAMHDGVCPQCGHVEEIEDMEDAMGNIECINEFCGFTITAIEGEAILSQSAAILERRLGSFKNVRSRLTLRSVE